jgi:type IV-A pilus assembly ATPase PilB
MHGGIGTGGFRNLLEEAGLVDADQLKQAVQMSEEEGQPLKDTIVKMGLAEEEDILQVLSHQLDMPLVNIGEYRIEPTTISVLEKDVAARFRALPIAVDENNKEVTIALADPFDVRALDDLTLILEGKGYRVNPVIGREEDIDAAIQRYYTGAEVEVEQLLEQTIREQQVGGDEEEDEEEEVDLGSYMHEIEGVDVEENDAPIIRLVNLIFQEALRSRASDIHFEPFEKHFRIRYRIDGVLQEIQSPHKRLQGAILSRLKIMSGMDLAEKRVPQDGRIQMRMQGREIDFRVSSLPGLFGESIVLRLLDKEGTMLGLEEVGFLPENIRLFEKLIRKPNGIILITGPTGSGKTTTLYSALNTINNIDTKIITVENPVEYQIEGVNQVQVNEAVGLTFAAGLRSMLRQSPDVILVGEIRDTETAEIAIRAALTGHLVFSTLHTNDAPSAPTRLVEMGIKPFLAASALQAVMAQRLVRLICPDCKEMYQPDANVIREFGYDAEEYSGVSFYRGRGCDACNYTGYRGRSAIHEVMLMSESIKHLVLQKAPSEKIQEQARLEGMKTLREDGWQKVLRGTTTIVEVARITMSDRA